MIIQIFGILILLFVFSLVSYDTCDSTKKYNDVKKKIKEMEMRKEIEMTEIKNLLNKYKHKET